MRTLFLIDGFNVYHSLKEASHDLGLSGKGTRWLNLAALCQAMLPNISAAATLTTVLYFSAYAKHRLTNDPDAINRHKKYVTCLEDTGIRVEMGRFKTKSGSCPHCRGAIPRHEEKETDVAISVALLEYFCTDRCDMAVIVTGDTDIAPAIRAARRLFPAKQIGVGFPYHRHNRELVKLADMTFQISKEQYHAYQFPDPYPLTNGYRMAKPAAW